MARTRRIRVTLASTGDELADARIEDHVYAQLCAMYPGLEIDLVTGSIELAEPVVRVGHQLDEELLGRVRSWIEDVKATQALAAEAS